MLSIAMGCTRAIFLKSIEGSRQGRHGYRQVLANAVKLGLLVLDQ